MKLNLNHPCFFSSSASSDASFDYLFVAFNNDAEASPPLTFLSSYASTTYQVFSFMAFNGVAEMVSPLSSLIAGVCTDVLTFCEDGNISPIGSHQAW